MVLHGIVGSAMSGVKLFSGPVKPVRFSPARCGRGGGLLWGWVLASLATVAVVSGEERLVPRDQQASFAGSSEQDRRTAWDAHAERMQKELVRWLQRAVEGAVRGDEADGAVTRWQRALDEIESKPVEDFHAVPSSAVPWFPHLEVNPYAQAYIRSVAEFTSWTELRGEEETGQRTSQQIRRQAYDLYPQVWAVCSPQSPHFRSVDRMITVLAQMDRLLHLQRDGDYNAGRERRDENMTRFTFAILSDAYWILVRSHPRLLPSGLRASWECQIRAGAEYQVRQFSRRNPRNPHGPYWYPNIDAVYAHQMYLAGKILDYPPYLERARSRVQRLGELLYADGGWPYLGLSNEEPAYHGVTLKWLIRYWQLSGDENARSAIRDSAAYYPLSTEAGGVISGSASPYWKHRWDAVTPEYPEAVSAIADEPMNKAVAADLLDRLGDSRLERTQPLPLGASFFDPERAAAELPDDLIVYDRNLEGPRGRFGSWSFTATGRDLAEDRGKYSYVGCLVTDTCPQTIYPLSGGLQVAFFEYLPAGDDCQPLHLTMNDRCHTRITERAAAFAAQAQMQRPQAGGGRSRARPWLQEQVWLMTDRRMVGHLLLYPDGSQVARGRAAVFRLGTGRGLPFLRGTDRGDASTRIQTGERRYRLGQLEMRIWDHNFERILVETRRHNRYRYPGRWVDVRLEDRGEGIERSYLPEDRRFVLVEFWPAGNEPSDEVTWRPTACGTDRLSVRVGKTTKTVYYSAQQDRLWLDGCGPEQPSPIFPLPPESGAN